MHTNLVSVFKVKTYHKLEELMAASHLMQTLKQKETILMFTKQDL